MALNLGGLGRFEPTFSSPYLLKRCANCPSAPPPCPACADGEVCSLIAGGCDSCPVTTCQQVGAAPSTTAAASSGNGSKSAAGPIAGGVIGGIAFVCLATFGVWWFCIRKRLAAKRREQYDEWEDTAAFDEKSNDGFESRRDTRASVHSVRSIASTVRTRASNVIQIAYIPGITNRSVESTPDLIPPVPPIPAASPYHSNASTPAPTQDQHFFMPSDLRDSTCSDYTVDRTSYARSSMAQSVGRGSVPSTAYRGSAIVHTEPAKMAIRGRANPVAVKSNGKNSPSDTPRTNTPPLPIMNRARYAPRAQGMQGDSPIVARLGVPKAVTVTKPASSGNLRAAAAKTAESSPKPQPETVLERKPSVAESRHNGDSSTFDDASSSDEESTADRSLMGHEKVPQFFKSSPKAGQGFQSPSSAPDLHTKNNAGSSSSTPPENHISQFASRERKHRHKRSGSLNQIIEEAARKASKEPRHGGLGSIGSVTGDWKRELRGSREGPFSDEHAAKTP